MTDLRGDLFNSFDLTKFGVAKTRRAQLRVPNDLWVVEITDDYKLAQVQAWESAGEGETNAMASNLEPMVSNLLVTSRKVVFQLFVLFHRPTQGLT